MLATIVDWAALGNVVLYSFAGALLLTGLYTTGLLLVDADGQGVPVARRAVAALCFALCLGLVGLGVFVMVTSK